MQAGSGWRKQTRQSTFIATPRGNGGGRCSLTLHAGKLGWCALTVTLRSARLVIMLRLSQTGALTTMLGGSLVRVPVSLSYGSFWLVQQHQKKKKKNARRAV